MARHGYEDDIDDPLAIGRWRGNVKRAISGKRGQAFLRDLAAALDAMPEKRLVSGVLQAKDGDCCAIGAVCKARGKDYTSHEDDEPYDLEELNAALAGELNIAQCLVQEAEYENDEGPQAETPEQRWQRMRRWVSKKLGQPTDEVVLGVAAG